MELKWHYVFPTKSLHGQTYRHPHPKQIKNLTVFKHECVSFLCVLYQKLLQLNLNEKKKPFQYQKKNSFLVKMPTYGSMFVFIKLHIWQLIFSQSYTHFDLYNSGTISECLSTTSSYVQCPWYSQWFKVKFNCFLFIIMIKWQLHVVHVQHYSPPIYECENTGLYF